MQGASQSRKHAVESKARLNEATLPGFAVDCTPVAYMVSCAGFDVTVRPFQTTAVSTAGWRLREALAGRSHSFEKAFVGGSDYIPVVVLLCMQAAAFPEVAAQVAVNKQLV